MKEKYIGDFQLFDLEEGHRSQYPYCPADTLVDASFLPDGRICLAAKDRWLILPKMNSK